MNTKKVHSLEKHKKRSPFNIITALQTNTRSQEMKSTDEEQICYVMLCYANSIINSTRERERERERPICLILLLIQY